MLQMLQNWGDLYMLLKALTTRKFGLSPIPDKVYRCTWFYAWDLPNQQHYHAHG